jgi:RNA polymerase sigma-70 factor (ECF subfamily)
MESISADAELWDSALAGDGQRFGALFDRHRDRVFRHAFWVLGDVHDAEDATAAAFLELWRRRSAVRVVNGSILPWLLVTTTNVCRNLRRAQGRYRTLLSELPRSETVPSAEEAAIDRLAIYDSVSPDLADALRSLSPADASLLVLVAIEGFGLAESATVLGISETAAKTRLHRLRGALRAHLADSNQDDARAEVLR